MEQKGIVPRENTAQPKGINTRNGEISWAKRKRGDNRRRVSEAQDRVTGKIVKMDGLTADDSTKNQVICDIL